MKYKYWFSNIGLAHQKCENILERYTPNEFYLLEKDKIRKIYGLSEKDIEKICDSRTKWDIDEQWMKLNEKGISFITEEDSLYPKRLKNIMDHPYALYYIGNLPKEDKKAVAIVGARGRSTYGSEVARKLGKELGRLGISVISGMARGIDADSHIGALEGNGNTYAVLGCGVDVCYPRENRYLYSKIPEKGGIISEYPIGTQPIPRLFPLRNRIISGMSDYIVVVEAREKSGSLITADYAMEQGKDVYAIPGRITDPLSKGCNKLIKQGAGTIIDIEDFLEEMEIYAENKCVQMDFRKNLLEKDELLVYSLLDFCPIGLGNLMEKLPFQLVELLNILEGLEAKGFARQAVPNFYIKTL